MSIKMDRDTINVHKHNENTFIVTVGNEIGTFNTDAIEQLLFEVRNCVDAEHQTVLDDFDHLDDPSYISVEQFYKVAPFYRQFTGGELGELYAHLCEKVSGWTDFVAQHNRITADAEAFGRSLEEL